MLNIYFRLPILAAIAERLRGHLLPVVRTPLGFKMLVTYHQTVKQWKAMREVEAHNIAWLEYLDSGDVIYDVGAHVGLTAIMAAAHCAGDCRVYAFETGQENISVLVQNARLNGLSRSITPINAAVGASTGIGEIQTTSFNEPGAGLGFYLKEHRRYGASTAGDIYPIPVYSIDDLVFKYGLTAPSHIKIDVDGAEGDVLEGAFRTLEHHCRTLNLEWDANEPTICAAVERCENMGFKRVYDRKVAEELGDLSHIRETIFVRSTLKPENEQ